ncbi:MAG: phosphotransferase [Betaproteobacteria bacterium]|nr:phosphotransferase [Betaproteobacteria bacterium]MDH4292713.1 phosphotransferase [Betaproteobacteria bacterium]MDH5342453.1 phosphotransferase [Betaproteobacteria bacterium]
MAECLSGEAFTLAPASADASFRRYFRVTVSHGTRIVMDAPPEREDCRPFIQVAQLMRDAGLHVPEILNADTGQGFLLLTDLGDTTYLRALTEDNAGDLFGDAIAALVVWQRASRPGVLPSYDRVLLQREMALFPEWYVGRHLGTTLSEKQRANLAQINELLVGSALAQPAVFVHRDYMPRNLMLSTPNPGILDFQDAVYGPITYDVVSLFRDAFVSWPEERVIDWTVRYWEQARRAHLPVDADFGAFYRAFEWMGLQRHLKVLGIFARIHHRDGKPGYLDDAPRFIRYVREVSARYRDLAPMVHLLDELEQRQPQAGYTF